MSPPIVPECPDLTPSELTALEVCSAESIYAPDHIQPHGIVLTLQEPNLTILQVSENVELFFGIPAEGLLGQPLQRLFSRPQVQRAIDWLTRNPQETYHAFELKTGRKAIQGNRQKSVQRFRCTLNRTTQGVILELEPQVFREKTDASPFYHRLQLAILNLRNTVNLSDLAQILAQEVKVITGFDRVMVYRFEADDHGVVIGEAKENSLESYLGLHYPAIDIPTPARQLFYRNWVRHIPDINYTHARLIPTNHPLTDAPLDLSACILRGVSPYHIEYLQHMGVAGSLTISLIGERRLWGLIACHHYSPRFVDYETRKTCEFLGQFASIELVYQQERELNTYRAQAKEIQDRLQHAFLQEPHFLEQVLARNANQLLNLVQAQGAAIWLDGSLTLVGQTPSEAEIHELVTWLVEQHPEERVFATASLPQIYPPAKQFQDRVSGVLAISIQLSYIKQKSYHILWFRPEQLQAVNWAGNPLEAVTLDEVGAMKLGPRKSFELWKETVRGNSYPWQVTELEAAAEMRNILMLAVLEFSQGALQHAMERATIANRAKSQFLAKMSHELRTPLNAILGFTQLMNRNPDTPAEFQEHLGIIIRSGEHLLTLINDVLEMSKIEAGQLSLTEQCFSIFQFIRSIEEMFALKAFEKGLIFRIEPDPNLIRYICGDRAKLRQIAINLLSNAIKFTTSGSIILRIKTTEDCDLVRSSKLPNSRTPIALYLEVEDTGCGIATSDLESVFEAFMQTESGRHAQGTGLGLSIGRQFARLMGGDITVQSTLNQGSTFVCKTVLYLPESLDFQESETNYQVIGLEPGQPTYRILVAEDVPENQQLLVTLLKSIGFEVCAVNNGEEAISHWRVWQPHLIFMDIHMPVLNGYDATKLIRVAEQNSQGDSSSLSVYPTLIIALTANAFEDDRTQSLQVGCNDYIAKPFTESALFDKIAYHLGVRYRYAEPASQISLPVLPKTLTSEDLKIMPPEWVDRVHEAALDLDDTQICQLIAQIPKEQKFLIEALTSLVDDFQLATIINLTEA